ncbi:hypothetical protein TSTA_094030 [Talaromyces stipitatus ATCC 10500]|uniref:Uncharacterized protein n=1 Tax=Talaromyces stipitatus (strain ATCC 10500 / CBS 375.48 / QM 6759 / NRRL 1006) TaxID=441959 RepID=B8M1S0_TALSN|nr:uncharacterized protein TSTA_094030 [Talaromyces stipitatus ATCC 10500]EED22157.1 hypothetical protein TSTA_094030 [Talaromyces stipitatus ATCC 10500]
MRAVPALDPKQWVGELDIIDVGDVVPEFLAKGYLLSDLVGMYKEKLGTEMDVLPVPEWMRKAKDLGMRKGVEATWTGSEVFVSTVLRKGGKL